VRDHAPADDPAGAGKCDGQRQVKKRRHMTAMVYGFLSAALGFMPVYWIGALVLVCGGWLMASDARRTGN